MDKYEFWDKMYREKTQQPEEPEVTDPELLVDGIEWEKLKKYDPYKWDDTEEEEKELEKVSLNDKTVKLEIDRNELCDILLACTSQYCISKDDRWMRIHEELKYALDLYDEQVRYGEDYIL